MSEARFPSPASISSWRRAVTPLQVACVVFPAALFGCLAWIDYQVESERMRDEVETTTGVLAEHAQTVVETADLVLTRVLDQIAGQDWAEIAASPRTHAVLLRLERELPQIEAVYLVDPTGTLAASSRAYPMPRYDLRDADYFTETRAQNTDGVVISAPLPAAMSGTKGFILSRRRVRDGRFDGVVSITISQRYFEAFYGTILRRPHASAAALVRTDGAVLVRVPSPPTMLHLLPASNAMMRAAATGGDFVLYGGRSVVDGAQRIAGLRRVHGVPLLAGFSISRSVLLTTWGIHAAIMAACAILLSLLLLITERAVRRRAATEYAALRQLVEQTERRRQVEALARQGQKMEALGRLTGGVAHDFNNLLAVILGSLELAQRRETNPGTARLLQTATEAAERGAKLTAQMLSFSRKNDVAVQSVDVNAVIRGMDDLLRRTLGPSIHLRYDMAEDGWPVLADLAQLELALLNLAVNARDAMPNGGDLTFRTRAVAAGDGLVSGLAPGNYVCVQVTDSGVGMSEDVRVHAHEPFFTTKGPGGGTGLGLSMVYGFVRDLGGALVIDSAPGAGTTVNLFLRKADAVPVATVTKPAVNIAPMRSGRILLVDDDASVRLSTRAMLEELGHNVVDAAGGAEALRILASQRQAGGRHFDLLLIDFAMPRMNGSQLAGEVTKLWPEAPILFVTGYAENDALRPWADRGCSTLHKPFSARDLAAAVDRTMRAADVTTLQHAEG